MGEDNQSLTSLVVFILDLMICHKAHMCLFFSSSQCNILLVWPQEQEYWGIITLHFPLHITLMMACCFCLSLRKQLVKDNVRTFVASYDFSLWKDWWGFNELPLCSPLDTTLTIYTRVYVIFSSITSPFIFCQLWLWICNPTR